MTKKIEWWSGVIATWVAILGALGGIFWGFVEYRDRLAGERVKTTLSYVERFQSPSLQGARSRIDEFWNSRAQTVFQKAKNEKELARYITEMNRKSRLEGDILVVVSFFDDLHVCTCERLCDDSVAQRFFGRYAFLFHGLMHPYFVDQRVKLNDITFGRSMDSFATAQRDKKSVTTFSCFQTRESQKRTGRYPLL